MTEETKESTAAAGAPSGGGVEAPAAPASAAGDLAAAEGSEFEEMPVEDAVENMYRVMEELQEYPDAEMRAKVLWMLDWVEAFHREGILRIVETVPSDVFEQLRQDPVVAHLFNTYIEEEGDAEDLDAVLEEALDDIRPYVHSHGGEMEVVGVDTSAGTVTLRLMGSCHGCPSSSLTLTQGVEAILREKWPGFRKLRVEGEQGGNGEAAPKKLLQIQSLRRG